MIPTASTNSDAFRDDEDGVLHVVREYLPTVFQRL